MENLEPTTKKQKKFDIDLAYGKVREQLIADILQDKKIELNLNAICGLGQVTLP